MESDSGMVRAKLSGFVFQVELSDGKRSCILLFSEYASLDKAPHSFGRNPEP